MVQVIAPKVVISLEQIPRVHLVCNIGQIVAPTVSYNHIALGLELVQVGRRDEG